jgi:hypothetical protein
MAPEALARRLIVGMLASCCILVACSRKAADVVVDWNVQPPRPSAGVEIAVQLRVANADGAPVTGAKLQCTAQMSHPGMAPIIATAVERGAGLYEARLELSMAGDWVLIATGGLPDGRRIESSFRVADVQPAKPSVPLS